VRFFRDDAFLRRAMGASLIFGLLGLCGRLWRDGIASRETYVQDTYDAANNLTHTLLGLAILSVIYVAVSLLLTPRARIPTVEDAGPAVSEQR
jgi:hypothetical protein